MGPGELGGKEYKPKPWPLKHSAWEGSVKHYKAVLR